MITLRKLKNCDKDYELLEKWYNQKEIYYNFEQRIISLDEIKEKYYPRTLENASIPVYMIEYNDNPIGIIQYQLINERNKKIYNIENNNCYEIDIFIGNLDFHNQGLGSKCINIISNYLFKEKDANLLVMCPLIENKQAIKCYKKCGYEITKTFTDKNTIGISKEYVLMIKK